MTLAQFNMLVNAHNKANDPNAKEGEGKAISTLMGMKG